ncbi:uncharacterized protein LOC126795584 [Argentina anserina]|uniref:uncharacterized protein LOC126795584 n=1 Tax=Argentina anserina TaxID=57926 RepID=UPI0021767EC3|nr:uncharacterized protein LOC126795584 [Potentilla anserina]
MEYFYEGLDSLNRQKLDSACGGNWWNQTRAEAKEIVENQAENSRQFQSRDRSMGASRRSLNTITIDGAIEKRLSSMENDIALIASAMKLRTTLQKIVLSEEQLRKTPKRRIDNPFLSYRSNNVLNPPTTPPGFQQRQHVGDVQQFGQRRVPQQEQAPGQTSIGTLTLEAMMQQMMFDSKKEREEMSAFRQEIKSSTQQQEKTIDLLERQSNAMVLKSGKVVDAAPVVKKLRRKWEEHVLEQIVPEEPSKVSLGTITQSVEEFSQPVENAPETNIESRPKPAMVCPLTSPLIITNVHFPSKLHKQVNEEIDKEILDVFKKVGVNIQLLDVIKQIPQYEKFLKNLCTSKRKFKGIEIVALSERVSAVLQRKLPPKLGDPGRFTIPCTIGDHMFAGALLDLGASINLMSYDVYDRMNMGELLPTGITIKLADRSNCCPRGIIEDVLVQEFIQYSLEDDPMQNSSKWLPVFEIGSAEDLEMEEEYYAMEETFESLSYMTGMSRKLITLPVSTNVFAPYIRKVLELELKPLPEHLKYVFLRDAETLPIIIYSNLSKLQEEKLLIVLREYKEAIG